MNMIASIGLAEARTMLAAASARAARDNWGVVIAVVDAGGHLLALERGAGAPLGSVQVAQDKARAAVLFKSPTRQFEDMVAGSMPQILALTGAMPLDGGLPLIVDGMVAGAIGVSGVKGFEDGIIAQAGLDGLAG